MAIYNLDSSVNFANLATKLRKDITYATVASSALTLAAFAGGIGIYIEKDANFAFTFDDDLKTGQEFRALVKNTHVSATITASMPTPYYGHTSPAAVTAAKYIEVYFRWNATISKWFIVWGGVYGASA